MTDRFIFIFVIALIFGATSATAQTRTSTACAVLLSRSADPERPRASRRDETPQAVLDIYRDALVTDLAIEKQLETDAVMRRLGQGSGEKPLFDEATYDLLKKAFQGAVDPGPVFDTVTQKPRPSDLSVPRRYAKAMLERSQRTNVSIEVLALQRPVRDLREDRAGAAGRAIWRQIRHAGDVARNGDLRRAIDLLERPDLLDATPFHYRMPREDMSVGADPNIDERIFYRHLIRKMRHLPSVSVRGTVTLPRPPSDAASPTHHAWAQRAWLRLAAEELGHVAQILLDRENPDGGRISQLLAPERSITRSLVALESDRLNQGALDASGGPSFIGFHNKEADIYAFMIEIFGAEFVPNWVGIDSGYEIRRVIDEELTARGVPGRAWPVVH